MKDLVGYINKLIEKDELWRFYKSKEWITLRDNVLMEQHNECQKCKDRGIIKRYDTDSKGKKKLITTVHHERHVRDYPELALSKYYIDENGIKRRQLNTICKACHNNEHPEKQIRNKSEKFVNEERW